MNIEIFSLSAELFGTIMIAFAALRVHSRVLNEQRMDKHVFTAIRRERKVGIFGVILVIIGYVTKMISIFS